MATRLTVRFREGGAHYRNWFFHECLRRGLKGTVRDRHDGSVEAVLVASFADVDAMVVIARKGPENCVVDGVGLDPCPDPLVTSMMLLPTA